MLCFQLVVDFFHPQAAKNNQNNECSFNIDALTSDATQTVSVWLMQLKLIFYLQYKNSLLVILNNKLPYYMPHTVKNQDKMLWCVYCHQKCERGCFTAVKRGRMWRHQFLSDQADLSEREGDLRSVSTTASHSVTNTHTVHSLCLKRFM